jgi:hypothetical protein
MQLRAALVIITGIVLAAVAIALGHMFAGVRVVRPIPLETTPGGS